MDIMEFTMDSICYDARFKDAKKSKNLELDTQTYNFSMLCYVYDP